jgi:hypothetical protein
MKDIEVHNIPLSIYEIKLTREEKNLFKIEYARRIENAFNKYNSDDYTIPQLTIKFKRQV